MKCAARVALGAAGGYFLGRTKKMKLALMLAGTAAGRQAGGPAALLGKSPGAFLGQGKKVLDASPELSRLVDEVRGRLLEAGKGAALAVAARQVESLTDRVAGRMESSLSNLAERGRPSTNSIDDEAERDDFERDEVGNVEAGDDEPHEATSDLGDDSNTNAAPVRASRSQGATGAGTSGTRTAVRRSTAAPSGARRSADRAAGRPARARERNANG